MDWNWACKQIALGKILDGAGYTEVQRFGEHIVRRSANNSFSTLHLSMKLLLADDWDLHKARKQNDQKFEFLQREDIQVALLAQIKDHPEVLKIPGMKEMIIAAGLQSFIEI